ncbi:Oidioi.mRNA.OKI2018_I69.PAR.g8907.t1.cds [Oikopleura dioica]|uniref:Oidioi.mRNA.OKI2018_I69.PAR.g8907.t1.cds n=1 Tax=Oikopleura dioica TaxID=34765 RepID=A0ABN7RQM5_OIKDI|nr:Oidioi.mRNA.OKI2018_I69.PAR.g8907.t1.cds [Oikopleura dioica]
MGKRDKLIYGPEDVPPWYMCILLGTQHFLTCLGSTVAIPLVLAPAFCLGDDPQSNLAKSYLMSTLFVGSGICTFIQATFGNRLPILQGGTFSFLTPTFALMATAPFLCDNKKLVQCTSSNITSSSLLSNETLFFTHETLNCCYDESMEDCRGFVEEPNDSVEVKWNEFYEDAKTCWSGDCGTQIITFDETWKRRVREVQGAIISASAVELVIGATGLIGVVLSFITPLAIAPVISLVGLSLFQPAANMSASCWPISIITIGFMVLFSQYLRDVNTPVPYINIKEKKCEVKMLPVFKVFPVLLALIISWGLCGILTAAANGGDGMANFDDPAHYWYKARTDTKNQVIADAPWFRFVYPFQWGWPTFSVAGFVGLLSGVFAGMLESIGDYYAAADISEVPPPPVHAINRGIMMEGVACIIDGILGSGNGTTTYSENISTLSITRCASRRMIQTAAVILFILGFFGKFTAFFVTLPDPVIGGIYFVITAPFIGGFFAIILDNTIPGTRKERGVDAWAQSSSDDDVDGLETYDIPWLSKVTNLSFMKYVPISPAFKGGSNAWTRKVCPCSQQVDDDEVTAKIESTDF